MCVASERWTDVSIGTSKATDIETVQIRSVYNIQFSTAKSWMMKRLRRGVATPFVGSAGRALASLHS